MISNMLRFPFTMLDHDMDDWFFPDTQRANTRRPRGYPPLNIGTTKDSVEVYLFVPGIAPDALDVVIEKSLLSVEGERKTSDAADKEHSTHRQERYEGRFKRVVTLPEEVDADKAEAVYRDGVLHISMPKRTEVKPRQINVSVA